MLPALLIALSACAAPELAVAPGMILPDAPPVFILLGDTQKTMTLEFWRAHHDDERRAVIRAVAEERPAFVVNSGDVVCHGGHGNDWERFCDENRPIFERGIAYFPALGNHDFYGGAEDGLAYRARIFPHIGTRRWFDVRFGSVLVAVLDSNLDRLSPGQVREQDRWLEDLLTSAEQDERIRHVILVCHHPPYTNASGLSEDTGVQAHFVSRLTPKVRVFFAGHVHNYERFEKKGVQFVVSGGGGGPTREVAPKGAHRDLYTGPRTHPFHYCRLSVDGPRLRFEVRMLMEDSRWETVDVFESR